MQSGFVEEISDGSFEFEIDVAIVEELSRRRVEERQHAETLL